MRKYLVLFVCLFLFMGMPVHAWGAPKKLISLDPDNVLFDVRNMAPGDWAVRELTVENVGDTEISYHPVVAFKDGSRKLFNELKLQIHLEEKELYKGKLADLTKLEARKLAKSKKESLTLRVDFPPELGNEFQGLAAKFIIGVTAKEETDSAAPGLGGSGTGTGSGGKPLPNTATNMFNFIAAGILLMAAGGAAMLWQRRRISG